MERILGIEIERIEYAERQKSLDIDYMAKSRYYQSSIDLSLLDKGMTYDQLTQSIVIFICNFDPFGHGRYIYTFQNLCLEDTNIHLQDETTKIFLNAKGSMDNASEELKAFLNYVSTGIPSEDAFIKQLDTEVRKARINREWRRDYMKYWVNLHIAKRDGRKEGSLLRELAQIRANYNNDVSIDTFAPILDIDVSYANLVIDLIKEHPEWNDEQIYNTLYPESND